MGRLGTSWELMKVSMAVIRKDKHLLIYPMISGIAAIAILVSFVIGIFVAGLLDFTYVSIMLYFVMYLAMYLVGIYFNTALIGCATIRLEGGDPTFKDGIAIANRNIGKILAWAVVAATVGLILRAIQERVGILGQIIIAIIGFAWTMATFFMIPVIIYENHGVFASIKRSAGVFKDTWGETFISSFGFGLIFGLFALIGLIPIVIGFMLFGFWGLVGGFITAIVYWVIIGLISSAAQGVLVAALYRYAITGKISPEFQHVSRFFNP